MRTNEEPLRVLDLFLTVLDVFSQSGLSGTSTDCSFFVKVLGVP